MAGTTGLESATSDVTGENASRLFSMICQPFQWLAGDTRRQEPTRNGPLSQALVTQLVTHRHGLPEPFTCTGSTMAKRLSSRNLLGSTWARAAISDFPSRYEPVYCWSGDPANTHSRTNNPFYPEGEAYIYRIDR